MTYSHINWTALQYNITNSKVKTKGKQSSTLNFKQAFYPRLPNVNILE